jgi:drug/metabolite transporter (DMT)-like permease
VVGSAVTFSLYYWLLRHVSATALSMISLLTPIVAVVVGAIFLDEPTTLRMLAGALLVVGGVALSASASRRPRAGGQPTVADAAATG